MIRSRLISGNVSRRGGPASVGIYRDQAATASESGSHSGSGRGATSSSCCRKRAAASAGERRRNSINELGVKITRCPSTGRIRRSTSERERAANGAADSDALELAGRAHDVDDPALDDLVHVDVLDRALQLDHLVDADHRHQLRERVAVPLLAQDPPLLVAPRVPERGLQQEAVELRLGEREGALLLDRILGRDHEKRVGQPPRLAVDGHLLLGHRLEQRRLRLRHRPVDLVDEQHVREDRPGPELEVARALVEDREPGGVARLEVGRALDPRGGSALDRLRDRPCEHGLRGPGDVLEQHVPAACERGDDVQDLLALSVHDPFDVVDEAPTDGRACLDSLLLRGVDSAILVERTRGLEPRRERP
jgi:hypothetical protein